jgi:3-hydroxyacyl-[acyl-carrier-protein] dehydratase
MTLAEFEALLPQLPRRYPALLIDRLIECVPGKSARALKCVTINEPYFQGHFPGYPVMPGVLVLEALIQLSTLLSESSGQGAPGTVQTIDGVRFKRQVIPGDQLMLETQMHGAGKFTVRASVDGELATEAEVVLVADAPLP